MKSAANKLPNDPQVLQQMLLAAMAREADLTAKTDALASAVERHAARAEWLQSVTEDRSLQIQRLESRSQAQDQQIAHLESVVAHKEARIEQLELLTRLIRQRQFGPRADQSPQQDLLWEEVETLQADLEQVDRNQGLTPQVTIPSRARKPFPERLDRVSSVAEPASQSCTCCGSMMRHIGDDVSEVLDVIPMQYRVIRLVRPKYACSGCQTIAQAPAQDRVIDRGTASSALMAQVVVDKYADHLPLYRQAERFKREGIDLDRSTLAGWMGRISGTVFPLVDAIRDHVKAGQKLHADETPAPTLAPGHGRTKTGYYWTYVRDDRPHQGEAPPAVWFQYTESRKGTETAKHLHGFTGAVQTDAYAGYNTLLASGAVRAGCWAHVRRKFMELVKLSEDSMASHAVSQIDALYALEKVLRGLPPDERRRRRHEMARPQLEQFKQWLDAQIAVCSRKTPLAGAIQYARKQWDDLIRYVDDGILEIDNNAAERAIRPLAVGRKNHLFAGSPAGGATGAIMYTLMGTAKLNGVDPRAYLTAVLKRINNTPITKIESLLPWNINLDEATYPEAV
jgi:transposase